MKYELDNKNVLINNNELIIKILEIDNNSYKETPSVNEVVYNNDGSFSHVRITDDIFNDKKELKKIMKQELLKQLNNKYIIIENGSKVIIDKKGINEYMYSNYSNNVSKNTLKIKGNLIPELENVIQNATNKRFKNYKKEKHVQDAKYGFIYYKIKFSILYNEKEKTHTGTLVIRNDENGKKYFYDIINIK